MAGSVAQAGYLDVAVSGIASSLVTVLARLGGWAGSGLNTVLGAFRALMAKAAALTPTDISTGTTFDNTTDSVEAVRDRGDAAWVTATGFATTAEIAARTGSQAVHSDIAGVRANGIPVTCRYRGKSDNGAKVYEYALL